MNYYARDPLFDRNDLENLKLKDSAVALGVFDAMHLGHQEIIKYTVKYAKEHNLNSVVYMFRNLPKGVLTGKDIKNVNLFKKRLKLIQQLGVDTVVAERFNTEYMKIGYKEFIDNILIEKLDAKFVCAGFNYHFGYKGEGNTENLTQICGEHGIVVHIAECKSLDKPVSSTLIRKLIADGEMEEAAKYLGRYFSVTRRVEKGDRLGHQLGFPTANINLPDFHVVPKFGVYISRARVGDKWYPSITNVGGKPTVSEKEPCIETHLLNFSGDLYGKEIEIEFHKYLRGISRFESVDALKARLEKDKKLAADYFKNKKL